MLTKKILRLQILLILILDGFAGAVTNLYLHSLSIHSMALRNVASMLVCYAVFFVLLSIWIKSISRSDSNGLEFGSNQSRGVPNPKTGKSHWWDSLDLPFDFEMGLGLFVFMCLMIVLVGGFLFFSGVESVIIDSGFEFAIAAGLVRSTHALQREKFISNVFHRTFIPFILILIFSTAAMVAIQHHAPGYDKLIPALRYLIFGGQNV